MASINDPDFAPPRALPFPAGTSPFRQKGNAYLGDIRCLNACVPGGFEAVVAALPEESTRNFFRQTFRPSDWYDAYPCAQLEVTAARLRQQTWEAHRHHTGAWHAEHAARSVYGALLRFVSNENIALWGPRISSLYFEFGKTETREIGPREIRGLRRGIPKDLVQWLVFAMVGFSATTLRLAGARDPAVTVVDVTPDGRQHGRELMQVELRLRWG